MQNGNPGRAFFFWLLDAGAHYPALHTLVAKMAHPTHAWWYAARTGRRTARGTTSSGKVQHRCVTVPEKKLINALSYIWGYSSAGSAVKAVTRPRVQCTSALHALLAHGTTCRFATGDTLRLRARKRARLRPAAPRIPPARGDPPPGRAQCAADPFCHACSSFSARPTSA